MRRVIFNPCLPPLASYGVIAVLNDLSEPKVLLVRPSHTYAYGVLKSGLYRPVDLDFLVSCLTIEEGQTFQVSGATKPGTDWVPPKGRKGSRESGRHAAIREFKEESGIHFPIEDFLLTENPVTEQYIGTDKRQYTTTYWTAIIPVEFESMLVLATSVTVEIAERTWYTRSELKELEQTGLLETRRLRIIEGALDRVAN